MSDCSLKGYEDPIHVPRLLSELEAGQIRCERTS